MATLEKSIEVQVPVNTAYNQWTQFEDYPRFMEDVEDPPEGTGDHIDYPAGDRPEMPGPEGGRGPYSLHHGRTCRCSARGHRRSDVKDRRMATGFAESEGLTRTLD